MQSTCDFSHKGNFNLMFREYKLQISSCAICAYPRSVIFFINSEIRSLRPFRTVATTRLFATSRKFRLDVRETCSLARVRAKSQNGAISRIGGLGAGYERGGINARRACGREWRGKLKVGNYRAYSLVGSFERYVQFSTVKST